MKTIIPCLLLGTLLSLASTLAAVPSLINYQGRLTEANGDPVTGSKTFIITIYDAETVGNVLYTENIGAVTFDDNGVYRFQFGAAGAGIGAALANSAEQWLELNIDGDSQTTRDRVLAVPFAQIAESANTVPDDAITATKLADNAVADHLAENGQSAVPSGALLVSNTPNNAQFIGQGNVMLDSVLRTQLPGDTNAPEFDGGSINTVVWTGTKLLVSGYAQDLVNGGFIFSGGYYDPASNSWTTITTTGAPEVDDVRRLTAVWTGTKLLVYGYAQDLVNGGDIFSGGSYDPASNSWTTITSTGAPEVHGGSHRDGSGLTAVWTGTKMIFYGAIGTTNITYGGGIYDPSVPSAGAWSKIRDASGGEKILFLYAKP